jgi:hypothetical protein
VEWRWEEARVARHAKEMVNIYFLCTLNLQGSTGEPRRTAVYIARVKARILVVSLEIFR